MPCIVLPCRRLASGSRLLPHRSIDRPAIDMQTLQEPQHQLPRLNFRFPRPTPRIPLDLELVRPFLATVIPMPLSERLQMRNHVVHQLRGRIDEPHQIQLAERHHHPVAAGGRWRTPRLVPEQQRVLLRDPPGHRGRETERPARVRHRLEDAAHEPPREDGVVTQAVPRVAAEFELVRAVAVLLGLHAPGPGGVDGVADGLDGGGREVEEAESVVFVH